LIFVIKQILKHISIDLYKMSEWTQNLASNLIKNYHMTVNGVDGPSFFIYDGEQYEVNTDIFTYQYYAKYLVKILFSLAGSFDFKYRIKIDFLAKEFNTTENMIKRELLFNYKNFINIFLKEFLEKINGGGVRMYNLCLDWYTNCIIDISNFLKSIGTSYGIDPNEITKSFDIVLKIIKSEGEKYNTMT